MRSRLARRSCSASTLLVECRGGDDGTVVGDLRRRLARAADAGSSAREAARRFEASASAAIKLVRRVRETGSAVPAKIGGHRKPLLSGHEGLPRELTEGRPGITLAEIQADLTKRGIEAGSLTTI